MDVYREEILEHWRSPQNFGQLKDADFMIEQVNPLCGDEVTFYFKIKNKKLTDVSFVGNGCAISIASASLLSEKLKKMPLDAVSKITGEDIFKLLGGPVSPARLKCAFLPLEVIKKLKI